MDLQLQCIQLQIKLRYQYNGITMQHLKNKKNQTVFDIMIHNKQIPSKQWCQNANYQDKNGNTQAMILAKQGLITPNYLYHQPEIHNNQGQTVAMFYAQSGIIPPKQWEHNKFIRGYYKNEDSYFSVKNILQQQHIDVPKQWDYEVIDDTDQTYAILQAQNGQIPDKEFYHDPYQSDKLLYTVSLHLLLNKIIPPKEWQHDPNFKVYLDYTNCQYLILQELPVPNFWYDKSYENKQQNDEVFEALLNKQIIHVQNYDMNKQNADGFTLAMIYVIYFNKLPPKDFYHKPELQNIYGETVAMLLVQNNIDVPQEWCHNPEIADIDNQTVAMLYARNGMIPPNIWNHDSYLQDSQQYTVGLFLADHGIIPPKQWEHDPLLKTKRGNTVAMLLAYQEIYPPIQWHHDPSLFCTFYEDQIDQDKLTQSMTVAMLLANNGIIPDKLWIHDKYLEDKIDHQTVGVLLAKNAIVPTQEWMYYTNQQDNQYHQSISTILMQKGYILTTDGFIFNCKIQQIKETCQICFTNEKQDFIITNCGHVICYQCFQQLIRLQSINRCPICKKYNWYQKLVQQQSISDSDESFDSYSSDYSYDSQSQYSN